MCACQHTHARSRRGFAILFPAARLKHSDYLNRSLYVRARGDAGSSVWGPRGSLVPITGPSGLRLSSCVRELCVHTLHPYPWPLQGWMEPDVPKTPAPKWPSAEEIRRCASEGVTQLLKKQQIRIGELNREKEEMRESLLEALAKEKDRARKAFPSPPPSFPIPFPVLPDPLRLGLLPTHPYPRASLRECRARSARGARTEVPCVFR